MVCAPVRSIIPSLKLGDYLSVQAHNPCSISHLMFGNEKVRAFVILPNFSQRISAYTLVSGVHRFNGHLPSQSCPFYDLILSIADKFFINAQPTQQNFAQTQILTAHA